MAVTFVAAGAAVASNNATLTPPLPAGAIAGDLYIAVSYARSSTATVATPAGWTLAELWFQLDYGYIRVFTKEVTGGETAPSLVPSGGVSNTTIIAQVFAVRGADPTNPTDISYSSPNTYSTTALGSSLAVLYEGPDAASITPSYVDGSGYLDIFGVVNDVTISITRVLQGTEWPVGSSLNESATFSTLSTLGTDASLTWQFFRPDYVTYLTPGRYVGSSYSASLAGANFLYRMWRINARRPVASYSFSGGGGAKVGGAASATYTPGFRTFTSAGTGRVKLGGVADILLHKVNSLYTGIGGFRLGGSATTVLYNIASYLVSGGGGVKLGGAASAILIARKVYYIDPYNGSDTNTGLSWVSAFKTFWPIAARQVTVSAGTQIRIAKTTDDIATGGIFTSRPLSGNSRSSYVYANFRTGPNGYALLPADAARIVVIDTALSNTGWVSTGDAVGYSLGSTSSDPTQGTQLYIGFNHDYYYTTLNVGQMVAYRPTASTLNLSALSRIEFSMQATIAPPSGYGNGSTPRLALRLCSDTLGATPLLSIPFDLGMNVVSYDGALPDGVNSISIVLVNKEDKAFGNFVVRSFIATLPLADPNYVGLYSQFRFGAHDGAVWSRAEYYTLSAGTTYVYLAYCNTGAAALHNTTLQLYRRNSVGWFYGPMRGAGNVANGPFDVLPISVHMAAGYKPLFDLSGMQGIASDYISIVGGYNTATNLVDGKTSIMDGDFARHTSYREFTSSFWLSDTSYVSFSNFNFMGSAMKLWLAVGDNHHITYDSCEFSHYAGYIYGAGTLFTANGDTTTTVHDMYFKTCRGSFIPTNHFAYVSDLNRPSVNNFYGTTIENGVLYPYGGAAYAGTNFSAYMFLSAITMIGDMKLYCVAATMSNSGTPEESRYRFPALTSGATGTVYVYGGGGMYFSPWMPVGTYTGVYTFPAKIVCENTIPMFICHNAMQNAGDSLVGVPEGSVVPALELTFSSSSWCDSVSSGSVNSFFTTDFLVWIYGAATPPVYIQSLKTFGSRWNTINGTTAIIGTYKASNTAGGLLHVKNIQLSLDTSWSYRFTDNAQTIVDHNLLIIDTLNLGSKAELIYTSGQSQIPYVSGHIELRDVSWTLPTSNTYFFYANTSNAGVLRFLRCNLTNFATASHFSIQQLPIHSNTSAYSANTMMRSGTILEDSPNMTIHTNILNQDTNSNVSNGYQLPSDIGNVARINTASGAYALYMNGAQLSKDFTTYTSGPFSWKSKLTVNMRFITMYNLPLGDVPLKAGSTVTISLKVRRATVTDNFVGMVINHRGSAGYATPQALMELKLISSAAANTWDTVSTTYTVQRSEVITISFAHMGVTQAIGWFDDLRVNEV